MKKYKFTPDGFIFEASTPLQIVEVLRNSGLFTSDQNINTYMLEFAQRAKIGYNIDLVYTNIDSFVNQLFEHNLLVLADG